MLKSFCVIPARSGSKGLKDKNVLELCGKPVLAYSIETCLSTGLFDKVYVATDSADYAEIAIKYGASVPFPEPHNMALDNVSSTEPLLYFYNKLNDQSELLWCIQPTSPLRVKQDLLDAYQILENDKLCNFVLSTTCIDPHYFHWALADNEDGKSALYFGNKMMVDRSLLKPAVYRPNGAIKAGRSSHVLSCRHFFGNNIRRVEMPEERAIHIRSKFDLDLCEMIIKRGYVC